MPKSCHQTMKKFVSRPYAIWLAFVLLASVAFVRSEESVLCPFVGEENACNCDSDCIESAEYCLCPKAMTCCATSLAQVQSDTMDKLKSNWTDSVEEIGLVSSSSKVMMMNGMWMVVAVQALYCLVL